MIESALFGIVAALVVFLSRYLPILLPGIDWFSPLYILEIGAFAMILQKFVLDRKRGSPNYNGMADLLIHIHAPFSADSPLRWGIHSLLSFLLTIFGGTVGPEGAATEFVQAIKIRLNFRSFRWFEQKRRTHAAASLGASISAAFGAPFTGMLLPIELGMGGAGLTVATSSLFAYLGIKLLQGYFSWANFDLSNGVSNFQFLSLIEWGGAIAIGCIAGVIGIGVIKFIRFTQEGLQGLFHVQAWMRVMAGAILLSLVFVSHKSFHLSSWIVLEEVIKLEHTRAEVLLFFCVQLISLALVLSGFGSIGLFWPIFALGSFVGFSVNHWILNGLTDFSAVASFMGGSAFWAVLLDTPLSGAILAYELTQNIYLFFPCLVAGLIAQLIRHLLNTTSLIERDLEFRGISLMDGRSKEILSSVSVTEAMVKDHEVVHEQESVRDLQNKILTSRYPFLPVVSTQGSFLGLLTSDVIQETWEGQEGKYSETSLSKVLEAKDLLYRRGYRSTSVRWNDRLSDVTEVFEELPCVPVVGEDNRVVGLLFVHNVRLAYDREVARRSYSMAWKQKTEGQS